MLKSIPNASQTLDTFFSVIHTLYSSFPRKRESIQGRIWILDQVENDKKYVEAGQVSPGFSLVEVLLYLIVVMALVVILLSAAGVLKKTRGADLETIATGIASCDIEKLRLLSFPPTPPATPIPPCDQNLTSLPAASFIRTVVDYGGCPPEPSCPPAPSPADPNIKKVTITISWTESSVTNSITSQTLISKYGLK